MRAHDSATGAARITVDAPSARPPAPGTTPAAARPAATAPPAGAASAPPPDTARGGVLLAALGVAAFSLTFPATVWALEGLGPWTVVMLRSVLAAAVAGACFAVRRTPLPVRRHWPGIAVVTCGIVLGFPLLTTLALETTTTSHAAVVVGLLPLTTAAFAALRTGTRPSRTFWIAALTGAAVVIAFALQQSGGRPGTGDLFLFAALLVCAAGYAEGGRLARAMPGWEVIGWALVLALPVTAAGSALALAAEPPHPTPHAVAGLVWLAAGSTFAGMVVWYRGMAAIGVARASQIQLAQPLLTLVWSVTLLGEHLPPAAPVAALLVLACIVVTQRSRG
ncbi:DMT family transporter [Streptomyces sp. NPDC014733]|uniref:DMT family transporter n=1 Tax=Streptomyces sp. NPDC014733 TaxID=3364885 RepID=UPI0036F7A5B2